jgi:hypothetical protein
VAAGAEGIEDLDRLRDPIKEEFESRVPMKQGSTAEPEMIMFFLEIFFKLAFYLYSLVKRRPYLGELGNPFFPLLSRNHQIV